MRTPQKDLAEQTRIMLDRYNEIFKFDHASLLRQSLGTFPTTSLADQLVKDLNGAFSAASLGIAPTTGIASELNHSVGEMLKSVSMLNGKSGVMPHASIAAFQSSELDSITRTLRDMTAGLSQSLLMPHSEITSLGEALREITKSYQGAFGIADALGRQLAEHQHGVAQAVAQMTTLQASEMARLFEGLDVGEWDDLGELETAEPDNVQDRLIRVLYAVLSRLDPRELRAGDYLAILFFFVAYCDPPFTQEDRENLSETREFSIMAAERAGKAAVAIDEIRRADIAREQLTRYISDLPRGQIISVGNVREHPDGSSKRIAVLEHGSPVAVSERRKRWLRVIFRDPLTDALAEGWLWAGSAQMLDHE